MSLKIILLKLLPHLPGANELTSTLPGLNVLNQETNLTNPTMHMYYIPQSIIQDRNIHISVLNGALWDMGHMHYGICEFGVELYTTMWIHAYYIITCFHY